MFKLRNFFIPAEQIVQLLGPSMGSGFATNRIMVEGKPIRVMYREKPDHDGDSGWRFMAGDETQEYVDVPDNWAIYSLNTIANYDRAIIRYLMAETGADFERIADSDIFRPWVE